MAASDVMPYAARDLICILGFSFSFCFQLVIVSFHMPEAKAQEPVNMKLDLEGLDDDNVPAPCGLARFYMLKFKSGASWAGTRAREEKNQEETNVRQTKCGIKADDS